MCDNAGVHVHWWFGHLGTVIGAVCALAFAGSLVRDRKPSGSTAAWLLAITLVPWLGVPLYFFFGGRKLRRATEKPDLGRRTTAQHSDDPIERVLISTGAGAPEPGHAIDWHRSDRQTSCHPSGNALVTLPPPPR